MFERFTVEARQAVVGAQEEARRLHHGRDRHRAPAPRPAATGATPSAAVLARHGLTRDVGRRRPSSATSAAATSTPTHSTTLGIDLDAVRERVEASFGPGALDGPPGEEPAGHIPFSPRAKKVLELSLREAIALKSRSIADGHIALGLLREGEGLAMKVLADRGVDTVALRTDLRWTRGLTALVDELQPDDAADDPHDQQEHLDQGRRLGAGQHRVDHGDGRHRCPPRPRTPCRPEARASRRPGRPCSAGRRRRRRPTGRAG